jgi:Carboxypeptidase regulatory-like domain
MGTTRIRVRSLLACILISAVGLASFTFSQTQTEGTISGTITDESGGVIPSVKVTATNRGTGQVQTTTSNELGRYVFLNLRFGSYDVAAEKQGFARCVNTGVTLDPAASVQLSCTLKVGSVNELVEVQAQALSVQTEDSKVSRVINDTQIQEIPVNGRNFASLLALQPGVTQEFAFNSFQGSGFSIFATESTHVNGLRGDQNNVQIEGAPSTRTRGNGAVTAPPSMDAIGEVNIVTTGYMPEYSRAGGGQVIIQMKSGTEQYHGSAYEYLRNDAMDARNYFAVAPTPKNILKYNNFGYAFGGPLIPRKKKLFFYWSQEWTRIASSYTLTATVPSLLARQGNFSEYCAANLAGCPTVPAYLANTNGLGPAGSRFPNDTVPQTLWSPNGAAFVGVMAIPNQAGLSNNSIQQIPQPNTIRTETVKVDSQFDSIKSHLAVSLRHYRADNFDDGFAGSSRLMNWNIQLPERGGTIDFTTTFSPTLLNDFTFTSTEDIVHVNLPSGPGLNRTALGINFPFLFGDASKDIAGKTPTITVSGFDTVNGSTNAYPSGSIGHVWQWQDIVTKNRGAHLMKFGVWIERDGEDDFDQLAIGGGAVNEPPNLNGAFRFAASSSVNPATTGAPLADVFLGNFDDYQELGFRNRTPWSGNQYGLFAQDTWKATPRLTISGGLRWDYYAPYSSKYCNWSTFAPFFYSTAANVKQVVDPTTGFIISGNPFNGIAAPCSKLPNDAVGHLKGVFGQPLTASTLDATNQKLIDTGIMRGLPGGIFQKHYRNFQPRLGFAWDPTGRGKTSVRASGGVFYAHITLSDSTLLGKNVPFQSAAQTFGGKADCPGSAVDLQTRSCQPGLNVAPLPIPISGGDPVSPIPVVYQWSTNIQHMFPGQTLIEAGYVGTRARHLAVNADFNQYRLGVLPALISANGGQANAPPNLAAANAPFPGFGQTMVGLNNANSQYDSLQASAQRRLHHDLQFGVSYTYSHAYDDGSNRYANAVDTYNVGLNWGPPDWQRNSILGINYVYDLPFLRKSHSLQGKIFGGWEIAGFVSYASGHPYNIISGSDVAVVGDNFNQNADRISGCDPNSGPHTRTQWFDAHCFQSPATGTFGNAGRNTVWGPGAGNWDFSLYKNGPITERFRYQFRAEFFNVLNHPSFNCDACIDHSNNNTLGDSSFGQLTGVNDPREVQLALRLMF